MKKIKQFIPKDVLVLIQELEELGYESWLVGGAVRNALLGQISADYDITTKAEPEQILVSLSDKYKIIPTGLKYGTVTIIINHHINVEVTTYRSEHGYSDARHPDRVKYVTNIKEDLSRRDFTINAIAWHPDRGLLDEFNGTSDLHLGIIKTVGEASERFAEDPLRILRALRFSSTLGFRLEKFTKEAACELRGKLKLVSPERLAHEWDQLLAGKNWLKVIAKHKIIIAEFIPYIGRINEDEISKNDEIYLRCKVITTGEINDNDKNMIIRHVVCAYLCNADVEELRYVLSKLRYGNKLQDQILTVYSLVLDVKGLLSLENSGWSNDNLSTEVWRILEKYGYDNVNFFISFAPCFSAQDNEKFLRFKEIVSDFTAAGLPVTIKDLCVNGSDVIIRTGHGEGEIIGDILEDLRQQVISQRVANNRSGQITWLENYGKSRNGNV